MRVRVPPGVPHAFLAQLVEQSTLNRQVRGSSPRERTKRVFPHALPETVAKPDIRQGSWMRVRLERIAWRRHGAVSPLGPKTLMAPEVTGSNPVGVAICVSSSVG